MTSELPSMLSVPLWQYPPLNVTKAEAAVLAVAARCGGAVFGSSGTAPGARTAKALAVKGALFWLSAREAGWERGMWGAYLTCVGWNALWRSAGDTHVNGCGQPWLPDGCCTGCSELRRLDLAAWEAMLGTLDPTQRASEVSRAALWCPEHGYLRQRHVTTAKVCMLPGSALHDGGVARLY